MPTAVNNEELADWRGTGTEPDGAITARELPEHRQRHRDFCSTARTAAQDHQWPRPGRFYPRRRRCDLRPSPDARRFRPGRQRRSPRGEVPREPPRRGIGPPLEPRVPQGTEPLALGTALRHSDQKQSLHESGRTRTSPRTCKLAGGGRTLEAAWGSELDGTPENRSRGGMNEGKSTQNRSPDPSQGPNLPVFRAGCSRGDEGGPRRPGSPEPRPGEPPSA